MRAMTDAEWAAIAAQIENDGHAVVRGVIDPETLRRAQRIVQDRVAANDGKYTQFSGPEGLREVLGADFSELPEFRALFERVCRGVTQPQAPGTPLVQFVRAFTGKDDADHALDFHFDSSVLTMLIPVLLPTGASAGNLLLAPNFRPIRKTYAANALDKAIYCNPLAQMIFRRLYRRRSPVIRHVALTPGDLYLFSGYRTLHSNESCEPDQIRSTAVFQFGNPHKRSWKGAPAPV